MENMEIDEVNIEEDIDGCIHSIHVRNFFCHDNLEVTLNRNVNFIVGRNGSGKSAVLTALVVGLGGRASTTNRGTSLSCKYTYSCLSLRIALAITQHMSLKKFDICYHCYKPNYLFCL